jgi:uncharacterized protein YfaS (alpha-2-macroglobulin family)
VRAFPDKPLLASGEKQKIFVIVQDQTGNPVQGALVKVTANMPDGITKIHRPDGTTNQDGYAQVEFDIPNLQPNQVITVTVTSNIVNGPDGQAETWFRIWW